MNFSQFIRILKARRLIFIATLSLVVISTLVAGLIIPKTYKAVASIVLNSKGSDPVTGMTLPASMMPGYISTQLEIITSEKVALKVVEKLKLTESQAALAMFNKATKGKGEIKTWMANLLLKNLEARPSRDSSIVDISFSGTDPEFVAMMANAFAEAYQETNIQLKVQPAQKAAEFLGLQTKILRNNLEDAQAKLAKYQQTKGLTSVAGSMDVESARLNDLSSQLVAVQNQAYEARSRQERTGGTGDESPDLAANPMVQNLKMDIARAESKFSELSDRLGPSHPKYQQSMAEITKLKSQLQEEKVKARSTIGGNASIQKQREAEIRAALAAQKARVLELNLARDQLTVLQRDLENAQRAMDQASQRLTQTSLEGSVNQTDIAILNPATPPLIADSPRVLFNTILAFFLGGMLGIFMSLTAEKLDRRIRCCDDISELLELPVLALINSRPVGPFFKLSKAFKAKAI
jgi:chain length determinant protein EpsF